MSRLRQHLAASAVSDRTESSDGSVEFPDPLTELDNSLQDLLQAVPLREDATDELRSLCHRVDEIAEEAFLSGPSEVAADLLQSIFVKVNQLSLMISRLQSAADTPPPAALSLPSKDEVLRSIDRNIRAQDDLVHKLTQSVHVSESESTCDEPDEFVSEPEPFEEDEDAVTPLRTPYHRRIATPALPTTSAREVQLADAHYATEYTPSQKLPFENAAFSLAEFTGVISV